MCRQTYDPYLPHYSHSTNPTLVKCTCAGKPSAHIFDVAYISRIQWLVECIRTTNMLFMSVTLPPFQLPISSLKRLHINIRLMSVIFSVFQFDMCPYLATHLAWLSNLIECPDETPWALISTSKYAQEHHHIASWHSTWSIGTTAECT
jgi:hypothetical protein